MCSLQVLIFCIKERVENSVPMELDKHSLQHVNICSGLYIYIIFSPGKFGFTLPYFSSEFMITVIKNKKNLINWICYNDYASMQIAEKASFFKGCLFFFH